MFAGNYSAVKTSGILKINLRPSFQDANDSRSSILINNRLNLLETEYSYSKRTFFLNKLIFFDVETISNFEWPLRKISWGLKAFYDKPLWTKKNYKSVNLQIPIGVGRVRSSLMTFITIGPRLTYFFHFNSIMPQALVKAGIQKIMSNWLLFIDVEIVRTMSDFYFEKKFNSKITYRTSELSSLSLSFSQGSYKDGPYSEYFTGLNIYL